MKPFLDGIMTGLLLQLALGPVFFYILGITVDSSYLNSLMAILAVTLADYIYIVLSLIGIGRLLQHDRAKTVFGLTSSLVLAIFGILIFYKGFGAFSTTVHSASMAWTPVNSFTSAFILTISSPLTIIFWSSIFSAKAIEKGYQKGQLTIFGLATGFSTFLFLCVTMLILSAVKSGIPTIAVQTLNCAVGVILITYGFTRGFKMIRDKKNAPQSLA
ncbi:MAG: hypothetical protein D3926_05500 [Desulfobacteraceae bacterium]|nr:MAG: hypothetical protein D3926_05500 [Desulfobacteraceae bacterium]